MDSPPPSLCFYPFLPSPYTLLHMLLLCQVSYSYYTPVAAVSRKPHSHHARCENVSYRFYGQLKCGKIPCYQILIH